MADDALASHFDAELLLLLLCALRSGPLAEAAQALEAVRWRSGRGDGAPPPCPRHTPSESALPLLPPRVGALKRPPPARAQEAGARQLLPRLVSPTAPLGPASALPTLPQTLASAR